MLELSLKLEGRGGSGARALRGGPPGLTRPPLPGDAGRAQGGGAAAEELFAGGSFQRAPEPEELPMPSAALLGGRALGGEVSGARAGGGAEAAPAGPAAGGAASDGLKRLLKIDGGGGGAGRGGGGGVPLPEIGLAADPTSGLKALLKLNGDA